jgi:hypothetical protein
MTYTPDELFELLPAIYRIRDADRGNVLKALVEVLANQALVIEKDIGQLYDNWFIETCDEWVVPYIGDLLGVRGLHSVGEATFSLRARVANTLAYRRRKGTAAMLEQLARDTTDWPAHAVEFFELLGWTQNYNHLRPTNLITPDLRRTDVLELLNTPFDKISHTVDVRHIASGRGKYNIPNIGLFLWRLQDYPLTAVADPNLKLVRGGATARAVASPPDGRFTFNPLGIDAPLFNQPKPETEITHLAEEINVPGPLRRRALYDELESRRQAITDGKTPTDSYFSDHWSVFQVFPGSGTNALQPEEIVICDLSDWHHPSSTKGYNKSSKPPYRTTDPNPPDQTFSIKAAIDPVLGRISFPSGVTPNDVYLEYAYGFSGDMSGGPYNRSKALRSLKTLDGENALLDKVIWRAGVSQTPLTGLNNVFSTLADAVDAWNQQPPNTVGTIAVLDSRTYVESLVGIHHIEIPEGSQLLIYSADLLTGSKLELAAPQNQRAHLHGNISVEGTAGSTATPGELILNGLLIEGDVKALKGNLGSLRVGDCTIAPASGDLSVNGANDELVVTVEKSICGAIDLQTFAAQLQIADSIVDGSGQPAVHAVQSRADLDTSTLFGTVDVKELYASNSIFAGTVTAQLHQSGCVRFCYVPDGSDTPRRFRCQPDLALTGIVDVPTQNEIKLRLKPSFTSTTYGDPAYAQLKLTVPMEIRMGADDGAEMGAFHFLQQPQREANLRASLDEYLRFSLEAGIFYAT